MVVAVDDLFQLKSMTGDYSPPLLLYLSPPLSAPPKEFADSEGTKYYYNAKTGLSQWERPAELDPQRPEPPPKPRHRDEPEPKKPPERNEFRNERKNEGTKAGRAGKHQGSSREVAGKLGMRMVGGWCDVVRCTYWSASGNCQMAGDGWWLGFLHDSFDDLVE